jgi:hypothetical protein
MAVVLWHFTMSSDTSSADQAGTWTGRDGHKVYGGAWHGPIFGTRLFGDAGIGSIDLERIDLAESGQSTDLRFRIER